MITPIVFKPEQSKQKRENNQHKTNFTGFTDALTSGLQWFDANPMLNVALIDTVSTDFPRTIVDLKTGIPAALETARREFSGLIVNCLIPSFFVLGVAKLINKPFMSGFGNGKVNLASSWADESTIKQLTSVIKDTASSKNRAKAYATKTLKSMEGFDGNGYVPYKKSGGKGLDKAIDIITDLINNPDKNLKEPLEQAHKHIVENTKASEVIRFTLDETKLAAKGLSAKEVKAAKDAAKITSNLSDFLRDMVVWGRKAIKDDIPVDQLDNFAKKAVKMVNTKSLIGLAIILPLAASVQKINRAITRRKYNKKGAPIYKDFEKGNTYKEMTPAEKSKFFVQKCFAASTMVGLALLSMMKKPSLQMLQFKGMFPTLDQCRWIATTTFASRMFASEDPNELRESTVRDIASFSGLYFLGDYAAKGVATAIEKRRPDVSLINRLKPDDKNAFFLKRFWNWVQNYKLKSFDEVKDLATSAGKMNAKNLRSICQISSLAFSIITLGILLPAYNRNVTNKKVQKQKEAETQKANDGNKGKDNVPSIYKKAFFN